MSETNETPVSVDESYENTAVRAAILALQETPDYQHLAAFLNSLREGHLVVDVTGTASKKKGARVRTIRSTTGKLVLPLFTSMAELRAAAASAPHESVQGAVLPARAALELITSDRFIAAEFDKASAALVCLRKYVTLAASDETITADLLETAR